jgi:hypothetical protein
MMTNSRPFCIILPLILTLETLFLVQEVAVSFDGQLRDEEKEVVYVLSIS